MLFARGWQALQQVLAGRTNAHRPTIAHGEAGIRQAGHREYVGGLWEHIGRLQFDFLVARGLRPEHYLLDVGCGCLRGGIHFIAYLEPGRYCGLEKEPLLLDAGRSELGHELLERKRPHLHLSAEFDCSPFTAPMDYGLAQSLFTHLPAPLIVTCLERIRPAFHPDGRFFATFFECDRSRRNPDRPHDHDYFAYLRWQMEEFGDQAGWQAEYVGEWDHPRGQRMMCYRCRG